MSARTGFLRAVIALSTGFLLLLSVGDGNATTVVKKDLDDLVIESDMIILGTVQGQSCDREINFHQKRSLLYTTYTIEVEQCLKGSKTGTVQFRVVGGQLDGAFLQVPGVPAFTSGDRVLLFLRSPIPDSICDIVGFEQGKFTVVENTVVENGMDIEDFLSLVSSRMDR